MKNKKITISTQADYVLAKFSPSGKPIDGVNYLAEVLNHTHRTKVRYWLESGVIPIDHWPSILTVTFGFVATYDFGKLVNPKDFIAHLFEHEFVREAWPEQANAVL